MQNSFDLQDGETDTLKHLLRVLFETCFFKKNSVKLAAYFPLPISALEINHITNSYEIKFKIQKLWNEYIIEHPLVG